MAQKKLRLPALLSIIDEDPEKAESRIRALYERAHSIPKLAEALDVGPYTAKSLLEHLGITPTIPTERAKRSSLWQVTDEEWLTQTDIQIAERFQYTVWNVRAFRRRQRFRKQKK